ncbi:D-alanyl-D-alanine carboxypeptidase [Actinoplanes octamycinicus]|uniref:D-alanyl-D-alanine carboxypeptidase n=1 Tax=Actinoplanes octamycinicus TaxID=135948 RepID=A0A7W7H010_9ACTN|nr:serine hydrolase domain-containing protein [Actinoplanes octamycinicus]MBB4741471.1 D-alanyl-D-alanine carboxypeptidase [Actinoplanes octamycinicus]GIE57021.1 D-alanyl-D-alanine carboxypeptidase [Actinoplanes octamycinicus]
MSTMTRAALRTACIATALAAVTAAGGTAHGATRPLDSSESQPAAALRAAPPAALRAALQDAVQAGNPAVLAYARQGDRQWRLAAGVADLATGRPARPDDHWRIFSNTKSFVSVVLLQLVAEGRLSLDDSVERWLPGVVRGNGNDGRKVTVRQLLNNTSGIADPDFGTDRGGHTPRQAIDAALAYPPVFPPGQGYSYSNTNYLLAGMVLEAVTHHRADREIQRRIIQPLRLTGTSFPLDDPSLPRPHLRGYDLSGRDVTGFNPSGEWTAGAMVSTTRDLARFGRALFGGRLLPPAQQRELLATVPGEDYGLGVKRLTVPCETGDVTVWETDGGGPGFNGMSMTSADTSHQLVLAANVFDLGIDKKHDPAQPPIPDARPAFFTAITTVFCS